MGWNEVGCGGWDRMGLGCWIGMQWEETLFTFIPAAKQETLQPPGMLPPARLPPATLQFFWILL